MASLPVRVFDWAITLLLLPTALMAAPPTAKVVKSSLPSSGIKTPGIGIPFANLKPEAQISLPSKPGWLFFSNSVFAPGVKGLERIDAKTNKAAEPIAGLDQPCGGMASAFGSLWVPACGEGKLARLDAKDYKPKEKIATGTSATLKGTVAASGDSVWALVDDKVTLARIDPDTNSVVGELRLPAGCQSLAFGETALWVACPKEDKVLRINPTTNLVEKRIEVAAKPIALTVGQGSIWVLCSKDGKVARIDPKTNKVSKSLELGVPQAEGGIAFGDGSVWVTLTGFPLTRIDPQAETVAQQFQGGNGTAIQASPGALWLLQANDGMLLRIDPKLVLATLAE